VVGGSAGASSGKRYHANPYCDSRPFIETQLPDDIETHCNN
jgi:hypothetical protein